MSYKTQIPEVGDYAIVCGKAGDLERFYGERVEITEIKEDTFPATSIIKTGYKKGELLSLKFDEFYIVE